MLNLAGRVAIVTGASRGIGRAIAQGLAAAGAQVVAAARAGRADPVARAIAADGGTAIGATVDVTDPASVAALVRTTLDRFDRVDILVNNAGIVRDRLLLRMSREDWDAVLSTNLTAAWTCCQAVLRPMIRQRSGRIVTIGSVVGESGNPGQVNYAASKAGLIGLSRSLALEVASRGVTVNVVAPGMIDTDMTEALAADVRDALLGRIPAGRLGRPDEIAAAVCFLASDEAAYITGQVMGVNGGMYM